MNNQLKKTMVMLMFVAISVVILLTVSYRNLSAELNNVETMLAESQARWEKTDAEKTRIQKLILNPWKENLKEQNQVLKEETERSAEIRTQNEELKKEISELKKKLGRPD